MWLGIALGGGIGLLYIAASRATRRRASRHDDERFMTVFLLGMVTRMGVALALVTVVLIAVPIHRLAFISSFLVTFVIGLIFEILELHRAGSPLPPDRSLP